MHFINSASGTAPLDGTILPDEFVLTSYTAGSHAINGFDPSQDIIELSKATFASFADVQANTSTSAGGALINLDGSSTLLISGIAPGQLHAANFAFA